MIITRETVPFSEEQNILLSSMSICPPDVLFFDIETTGFKAGTSRVYLIGAVISGQDGWILCQWMTETAAEEDALLRTFEAFLRPYHTVIHFNGTRFDIPYLEEKLSSLGLASPFSEKTSIDLYKMIFPFRKLLSLTSLRQKALENACGLHREDRYSGGDLIDVRRAFEKDGDPLLKELLLLHNLEDLKGMLFLLPLCSYHLLKQALSNEGKECRFHFLYEKNAMTFLLDCPWHFPISCSSGPLRLSDRRLTLTLPVISDTLKYFFDDPGSYYYLPTEDTAIHKSVAMFVDRKYRKQATRQTCYTKKSGNFIPQPPKPYEPLFRKGCKDKAGWYLFPDTFLTDTRLQTEYFFRFLEGLF